MNNNNEFGFKTPDEAFEYLVNQRLDAKKGKELAEALGSGPDKIPKEKPTEYKRIYIRLGSIAAATLLIGGFFLYSQTSQPLDKYASDLIQQTEIGMSYGSESRGANSIIKSKEIASIKRELTTVLLDQDFNQAVRCFGQMEKVSALSIEDKYYYAISLLKSKGEDYHKAIRLLTDVINANDYNIEDALWLRSLTYGAMENKQLMREDLNKLNSISKNREKKVIDLLTEY